MENKALGRGLSALIPEKSRQVEQNHVATLPVSKIIDNRYQPRLNYDIEKLDELKESIREKGILQPIIVRQVDDKYEVVAGERRLKAARLLNLEHIPVVIKNVSDKETLVIALIENLQREELNPIEEAEAYKKLIEDFEYTQEAVAHSVGKDRSTVTNTLRLLKLPESIQQSVFKGELSLGHARTLLGAASTAEQIRLYHLTLNKKLSVRQLEHLVRSKSNLSLKTLKESSGKDHEIAALEENLRKSLGTKVSIFSKKKRGKVVIEYYSLDDLDRIISRIKGER